MRLPFIAQSCVCALLRLQSTAPAAPLTPMSAAEDFVSLAAALILLLPVERAAHAALFDPSRLAALSWGVSEAYNRDSVELLSVIYTFETKCVR